MNMLWIALGASALCATANLIDRGLVDGDGDESSPWTLMAIGGFFNLLMALVLGIWVLPKHGIDLAVFLPLFSNGIVFVIAIWLYLVCLKTEETSRVIPFYQIMILIIGGFALSMKKGLIKGKLAGYMIISSGLIALNDVVFANFGRGYANSETIFADWCGKAFFGLLFLVHGKARNGFISGLRAKMGLMLASEVSFSLGDALLDVAKLVMPVAIAQAAFCTQPLFVFVGVVILAKRFPALKEDFGRGEITHKIIGIILMVVGGILLSV
jgi:hypothetical protein